MYGFCATQTQDAVNQVATGTPQASAVPSGDVSGCEWGGFGLFACFLRCYIVAAREACGQLCVNDCITADEVPAVHGDDALRALQAASVTTSVTPTSSAAPSPVSPSISRSVTPTITVTPSATNSASHITINVAQVLNELFVATNGATWKVKTNWGSGDPCANAWYGVVCNAAVPNAVVL